MKDNTSKIEKVLDKIKKLLALAGNNPSEEEAMAAALKAQELMAEYNVTVTDEEDKIEMSESGFSTGVDNNWKYILSDVVATNFRCRTYWLGKKRVIFYGYKSDCEIASQVFEFLFKICKKRTNQVADKAYVETGTSKGVRYSYSRGFVAGVKEALDAQCTALMIITPPEVNEYFDSMCVERGFKTMGGCRTGYNGIDPDTFNLGKTDGKDSIKSRGIERR